MKICCYDDGSPGLIENDSIYPLGDALATAGATRVGATMAEVIDALANHPSAAPVIDKCRATASKARREFSGGRRRGMSSGI